MLRMQSPVGSDQRRASLAGEREVETVVSRVTQPQRQGQPIDEQAGTVVYLQRHLQQPPHAELRSARG